MNWQKILKEKTPKKMNLDTKRCQQCSKEWDYTDEKRPSLFCQKCRGIGKGELSPKQKKLDRNNNGKIDGEDFAMLREKVSKEIKTFEKDKNEAASAASLSDLKEQLKDAPKYIKTALNEIERYLQGE